MAAVYPGAVRSFTTKVNNVDIIEAAHPNTIQEEVVAIQSIVGVNPNVSTNATATGWVSTSTSFATLAERIANIEKGIVADTHTQYVSRSGGSTITTATASTKGLVVKASSGQTANLQEWQGADGSVLAYISPSGAFVTSVSGTDEISNLYVLSLLFG